MKNIEPDVINWYSRDDMWEANSHTYPKASNYIDCALLDVNSMVTDKTVLNLGCCYPSDEMQFSATAKKWVAVDFSPKVIERCKKLMAADNLEFIEMNMKNLEFPESTFDTVLDFSSGDHVTEDDYNVVLTEVYRVLKPEGIFIVTYANRNVFISKDQYGDFGYWRCDTPEEMKGKLEKVGFKVIRQEGYPEDRAGAVGKKL